MFLYNRATKNPKSDKERVIINLPGSDEDMQHQIEIAKNNAERFSPSRHYGFKISRSAWVKTIDKIDENKIGGYSFLGERFEFGEEIRVPVTSYIVTCERVYIAGNWYADQSKPRSGIIAKLFYVEEDGSLTCLKEVGGNKTKTWFKIIWTAYYKHKEVSEVTAS